MGNVRQFHSENDPQLLPDNACLWRYVPLKTLFFYLSGNIFILHPYFLKRKEYQSENEVRFVTCGRENRNLGGILLEEIDPKDWIQQILFWPKLTSLEENCLKSAVEKYVPNIPCSKSDLMSNNSGQFSGDSMFASYISGLEDASWKNNDDGIPEILKKI